MVFGSYIHLYSLLLLAQHCCHLLTGKFANQIQEIVHSEEYYWEDGIKLGK
jgi:hypothetical protein